jgi:hypothetical protein
VIYRYTVGMPYIFRTRIADGANLRASAK